MTEPLIDFNLIATDDAAATFANVRAARQSFISATTSIGNLWNGPLCTVCKKGYIGQHTCSVADLQTQIAWLQAHIDTIEREAADPSPPYDGDGEPV